MRRFRWMNSYVSDIMTGLQKASQLSKLTAALPSDTFIAFQPHERWRKIDVHLITKPEFIKEPDEGTMSEHRLAHMT